jgi:glycosyltransferase involved in cell wall biosynthesis
VSQPALSVVVPVYGCGDCLTALHARLTKSLADIAPDYEIVLVDDRSPDGAWSTLRGLALDDHRVQVIRLSRNFGQHVAITAGIAQTSGKWVVLMDCDLQDRPEDIGRLYAKAQEGYDIVFSKRMSRRQSLFRRVAARAYFKLRNRLLRTKVDVEHGSLMLFSGQVADEFLRVRDKDRQHAIILTWLGFESTMVELEHAERHAGRSSYTLGKLLASAADGLFFQTTLFLRWIVYTGFLVALSGFMLTVALIAFYLFVNPPPGWTSLAVLILVIGGVTITSLGVSALYVGKIFDQVKDRPLYVIDKAIIDGAEVEPKTLTPGRQILSGQEIEA